MLRIVRFASLAAMIGCLAGCGQSGGSGANQTAHDGTTPQTAVQQFLEAVRTGNDEKASAMLTPMARQRTSEMSLEVAPPGSDTAAFTVGEVEMVSDTGAHVASTWSDVDEEGERHTDSIIWMVSKEDEGWRVVGMATKIFADEPPLYLNFEDPEDMIRKQRLAAAEMERRAGHIAETAEEGAQPSTQSAARPAGTKTE